MAEPESSALDAPLSDSVERAIAEILGGSADDVDAPLFDVCDYINSAFPDEASLSGIGAFVARIDREVASLDASVADSVREQSVAGPRAAADIAAAKESIAGLFTKIRDIAAKAEASETMVTELCADIRQLDTAKKNLTTSITTLKQLQMLSTGVEALAGFSESRQYEGASEMLGVVTQLFTHFRAYETVPRIAALHTTVSRVKEALREQIEGDFDVLTELGAAAVAEAAAAPAPPRGRPAGSSPEAARPADEVTALETLHYACVVVDCLHRSVRRRLVNRFCEKLLLPGDGMFGSGEGAALENVERRFAWFRRTLRNAEERFGEVLPRHWRVMHRLGISFCARTRAGVEVILAAYDPPESAPAENLVKAMRAALMFEGEMTRRFVEGKVGVGGGRGGDAGEDVLVDAEGERVDPTSAAGIRMKYAARKAAAVEEAATVSVRSAEADREAWLAGLGDGSAPSSGGMDRGDDDDIPPFAGLVSQAFHPYLGAYVALERGRLSAIAVAKGDEADEVGKLQSSTKLVSEIKAAVQRCTSLHTGSTLLDLFNEIRRLLSRYASALRRRLPMPSSSGKLALPGETYVLKKDQHVEVCVILNTTEFWVSQLPGLQEWVEKRVDPEYVRDVTVEEQVGEFESIAAAALAAASSGVACLLDSAIKKMTEMTWTVAMDDVDEVPFLIEIRSVIRTAVPQVRRVLTSAGNTHQFRRFCDHFARAFIPRLATGVLRCKRIGESGAQCMQRQISSIKALLLEVPSMTAGEGDESSSLGFGVYAKFVNKEVPRIEAMLILLGMPRERLADKESVNVIKASVGLSADDLVHVMELKGLKRSEQAEILSDLHETPSVPLGNGGGGGGGSGVTSMLSSLMK